MRRVQECVGAGGQSGLQRERSRSEGVAERAKMNTGGNGGSGGIGLSWGLLREVSEGGGWQEGGEGGAGKVGALESRDKGLQASSSQSCALHRAWCTGGA